MQLVVGRIGGAHGVRGEVSVEVCTDDPDLRFAAGSCLGTDPLGSGPLTVSSARWHGAKLLVAFAEVDDRSAAEKLRDTFLFVDSEGLPSSANSEEFNDYELVDLTAVTTSGKDLGVVVDVLHTPAQDLLLVALRAGGEVMVPFVAAIVHRVERASSRIVLDPPPGLVDPGERA